jgi:hypothetical protein
LRTKSPDPRKTQKQIKTEYYEIRNTKSHNLPPIGPLTFFHSFGLTVRLVLLWITWASEPVERADVVEN